MKEKKEFSKQLVAMNGKPYAEYGKFIGDCDFGRYVIRLSGKGFDPGASATEFTVRVPQSIAAFPYDLFDSPVRRVALEDLLLRKFAASIEEVAAFGEDGIARCHIDIAAPGNKILPRTAMAVTKEFVEARIWIELPCKKLSYVKTGDARVIDADMAYQVFFNDLAKAVNSSMVYCNVDFDEVEYAVSQMEDSGQIRQSLPTQGLVSFVAEGSVPGRLPESDDLNPDAEPFMVDAGCTLEMQTPNSGIVKGIGVPAGLTVIVGESNGGRLDFLDAVASGIYNHCAGDGRELAVTVSDAVQVTAEPGRSVRRVDVSLFAGSDCEDYSTDCADAFMSQAAGLVEALEAGARVLILDESTSDPEFLVGTRGLGIFEENRRIPFAARVRQLVDELGVSVVVSGAGLVSDFIPLADAVIKVEGNKASIVTDAAKSLGLPAPKAVPAADLAKVLDRVRWIMPGSIDPSCGVEDLVVEAEYADLLRFGRNLIDLSCVTQLADAAQTETIGYVLHYARLRYMDGRASLREMLDWIDRDLTAEGLDTLTRDVNGSLARPRRYEVAAALNRMAATRVSHATVASE